MSSLNKMGISVAQCIQGSWFYPFPSHWNGFPCSVIFWCSENFDGLWISVYFSCIFHYTSCISMIFSFRKTFDALSIMLMIACYFTLISRISPQILPSIFSLPFSPGDKLSGRKKLMGIWYINMHACMHQKLRIH